MQTVTAAAPPTLAKNSDANNNANSKPSTATIYHVAVMLRGPSGRSNRLDAFKIGQPAQ
jgi:hypothetical protein